MSQALARSSSKRASERSFRAKSFTRAPTRALLRALRRAAPTRTPSNNESFPRERKEVPLLWASHETGELLFFFYREKDSSLAGVHAAQYVWRRPLGVPSLFHSPSLLSGDSRLLGWEIGCQCDECFMPMKICFNYKQEIWFCKFWLNNLCVHVRFTKI